MYKLHNFSLTHFSLTHFSLTHSPLVTTCSLAVMVAFLVRKRLALERLLPDAKNLFSPVPLRTTLRLYSKRYLLCKAALYTYYLVVPFRCSYIGYLIKYEDAVSVVAHASLDPVFSHYSIVLRIFRDPFSANAFGALGIYAFYVDYAVYFKFYSIGGHFFRLLDRLFEIGAAERKENDNENYFFELEVLQRTAHYVRLQSAPAKVALCGLVLVWSVLSGLFLRLLYHSLPSLGVFLLACLDHGLMFYGSVNSIRLGLFLVEILLLLTVGTRAQMARLNRSINRRLAREALYRRVFPGRGNSPGRLVTAFESYQDAHWRLFTSARHLNAVFVSQFMSVTVACNLLINALTIALIIHDQLTTGEQVLFGVLIAVQVVLIGGACLIFIRYGNALHWPARAVVVRLQMAIEGARRKRSRNLESSMVEAEDGSGSSCLRRLRTKLRLLAYYELVHRRNRFHFTIGSMAKITSRTIYKVYCFVDV